VAGPTLKSKGPSTVFAPTNEAFDKLPEGTVAMLVKPENKQKLTGILTYHVVGGKLTAKKLSKEIEAGGGQVKLKTVNGETLIAKAFGDSAFTNQVRSAPIGARLFYRSVPFTRSRRPDQCCMIQLG
jgi:uncharacterized surface protein with fasciclin (FAS1) repeats